VAVEDYFHSRDLSRAVRLKHWERLESRLDANVDEVLGFLAEANVRATFFVFGWTAERHPRTVRRIAAAGHEVASRGYWPWRVGGATATELRRQLRRTREALEAATSTPVIGFRAPAWIREDELWTLDVLAEEGYLYDSSVNPVLRRFRRAPCLLRAHRHRASAGGPGIWEFPVSTVALLGWRVAISGGNYIRQLPHTLLRRAVARWDRDVPAPLVFYFMPWELDRGQPTIDGLPLLDRVRHYRNLDKTRWVLREYFARYSFTGIASFLGVPMPSARPAAEAERAELRAATAAGPAQAEDVTLVVPVFDEKANIAYLQRTLAELRRRLRDRYRVRIVIVDDGSRDGSWDELQRCFASEPDCDLVRHPANRGVAAAILTGIRAARTDVVCSIDCDCSYDPAVLTEMLPLLAGADLVTASPYHPAGRVVNVPRPRLLLSRTLSRLYSALLGRRIHTFTSCCRVYRRAAVLGLELRHGGFLGVAELLIQALHAGLRVVEHPATLESRLLGVSKMRTLRAVAAHGRLLAELGLRSTRGARSRLAHAARPHAESGD
jgi:polysaccharide deacetylase family protein (PEP-CTERM system associated)